MKHDRPEKPDPPRTSAPPSPPPRGQARDYRRVCPNCAAELYDRSCKSRCPRCGFFTDCSDPW